MKLIRAARREVAQRRELSPAAMSRIGPNLLLVLLTLTSLVVGPSSSSGMANGTQNDFFGQPKTKIVASGVVPKRFDAVSTATNPLHTQALPLGHLNPFGGAQVFGRPPASEPVAGAQLWPAPQRDVVALAGPVAETETETVSETEDPVGQQPAGGGGVSVGRLEMIDGVNKTTPDDGQHSDKSQRRQRRRRPRASANRPDDSQDQTTRRPLIGPGAGTNSEQKQLNRVISSFGETAQLRPTADSSKVARDEADLNLIERRQTTAPMEIGKSLAGTFKKLANSRIKCRVEKDLYLEFEEYQHYTCAHCYNQVPPEYFNNKLILVRADGQMIRLGDRESNQLIWTNETNKIKQTFKVEEKFEKWQICCRQANDCCLENAKHLPRAVMGSSDDQNDLGASGQMVDDPERNECPGTWDGLSCWPPSAAGQLAWRECPRVAYLLDFEPACRGYVTKQCFQNASWFINRNGHEWSDYSTCSPEGLYKARMLHASVAYVCEALIVVPALLIIGKFPNRGGNKRIRIMKSLLFYILLNSLIQALQRGFLAAGYFAEYRVGPALLEHHSTSRQQLQQQQQRDQSAVPTKLAPIASPLADDAGGSVLAERQGNLSLTTESPSRLPVETTNSERLLRRRHARSTAGDLWPRLGSAISEIVAREDNEANGVGRQLLRQNNVDNEVEEQDDIELDTEDDDDDDDANELVARIFSTSSHNDQGHWPLFRFLANLAGWPRNENSENKFQASSWLLSGDAPSRPLDSMPATEHNKPLLTVADGNNKYKNKLAPNDHVSSNFQLVTRISASNGHSSSSRANSMDRDDDNLSRATSSSSSDQELGDSLKVSTTTTAIVKRLKRNTTNTSSSAQQEQRQLQAQMARAKRKESAWKAFFCWLLQMASRLVRLMSYAWMFTGGVYLCSALHFAPAEPPAKFIKILFFLTNAFPNLIFFAYVTARTINEPSPLNIIIKAPYYWLQGDEKQIERLYETQKVCWFEESKSQSIEDIADLPNLILVASNVALFVITLVILCRINRPGSTRPDMSPCAYFKAAGTLLFLYGGHYFFLAYRPESESCSVDTIMFYAFICIDVVQGIAISIVFCYMTQEGKSVIVKYWRNKHRFTPFRQIVWLSCFGDKYKLADNGYHHTPYNNVRLNQSTRSNTSGCNGHNDNVTELVNINDTQVSGHF